MSNRVEFMFGLYVCDSFPPHRTGRADFPHPALLKALSQKRAQRQPAWLMAQILSQRREFHRPCRIFRRGTIKVQAALLSYRQNHASVRPLGSIPVTGLPRYYGPLRLPMTASRWLCLPTSTRDLTCVQSLPHGVSQVPRLIFRHALPPSTPESLMAACSLLHHQLQASPSLGGWPLS